MLYVSWLRLISPRLTVLLRRSSQVLVRLALVGTPFRPYVVAHSIRLQVHPQAGWFRDAAVDGTHYVGRLVLTRWQVVQGPRRCAFSHISAGKAPQFTEVYRRLASRMEH